MADAFLDRVGKHQGELTKHLGKLSGMMLNVASVLKDAGLDDWSEKARAEAKAIMELARECMAISLQCFESTPLAGSLPTAKRPTGAYATQENRDDEV